MRPALEHVSRAHLAFVDSSAPEVWDETVYAPGTYDSFIWSLQQPLLREWATQLSLRRPGFTYLDFACGTGRVLAVVAPFAGRSVGLDISAVMLARAAARVPQASFVEGDVLAQPDLAGDGYDLVTAFRFFLNAAPALRLPVLEALVAKLRDRDSRLVLNIHSNSFSVGGIGSRIRGEQHMSPLEVRRLVAGAGLEIEALYGFGVGPGCRTALSPLRPVVRAFDRWTAHRQALRAVSRDLLLFCRKP